MAEGDEQIGEHKLSHPLAMRAFLGLTDFAIVFAIVDVHKKLGP
jgi:hypothetical protein